MDRLYLEFAPDPDAQNYLVGLQHSLGLVGGSSIAVNPRELHMTLIHFGSTSNVYTELTQHNPELGKDVFDAALQVFTDNVQHIVAPSVAVDITGIARFGHAGQILVVVLTVPDSFRVLHQTCLELLTNFFHTCGIEKPVTYMYAHHNFKHALTLNPHITLARNVQAVADVSVQRKKLHLNLVPLNYDMKHDRYT